MPGLMGKITLAPVRLFQNMSIRHKLVVIIMITGGLPMLLASVAIFTKDVIFSRNRKINDLSSLALVVGMNSEGALVFNDTFVAETNLSAFAAIPPIMAACIYDREGKLFAWYPKQQGVVFPPCRGAGFEINNHELLLFQEIRSFNEIIGTVFIRYDMRDVYRDLAKWGLVMLTILLFAFCLAFGLSHLFQRIISKPVLDLARVARRITEKEDFSERAEKCDMDEIKVLVDGFNEMLMKIQKRDEELEKYREHLEEKVLERTTELQQANQRLIDAKEMAESANRAKTEFLAGISHEIRTPLNAVLGFAELLSSMIVDERQKSYLESIHTSGKNLLTLINDILDLSKIEARKLELQYEPVNPGAVFREVKDVFSLKIQEKGLDFVIAIDPEIPAALLLDEVRLRQVLFNLIGNAVKFTSSGYIRLNAEKIAHDPQENTLDLRILVEDTGIGISPDSLAGIFDAFRQQDGQSNKKYGGTGLGLAITKRLTEMMNGVISVTSAIDRGSQFEIIFRGVKISAEPPKATEIYPKQAVNIRFFPATILIVDDVEANRSLAKAYLMNAGLAFLEAENGKIAVDMAKIHRPALILMDIRMPIMDGYKAADAIRLDPEIKHTPIIALTASGMKHDREKTMSSGFDGFISKPVQKADLLLMMAQFLAHGEPETDRSPPAQQASLAIPAEQFPAVQQFLQRFELDILPEFESVQKTGFFNEIQAFAEHIKALGQTYRLDHIIQYGNELITHVSSFDIEKMNAALQAFPRILNALKSCCDKQSTIGESLSKENNHESQRR